MQAPSVQPLLQDTVSPGEEGWATPRKRHSPLTRRDSVRKRIHPPQQPPKKPPCSRKDNVFMRVALRHWRDSKFWSI